MEVNYRILKLGTEYLSYEQNIEVKYRILKLSTELQNIKARYRIFKL